MKKTPFKMYEVDTVLYNRDQSERNWSVTNEFGKLPMNSYFVPVNKNSHYVGDLYKKVGPSEFIHILSGSRYSNVTNVFDHNNRLVRVSVKIEVFEV